MGLYEPLSNVRLLREDELQYGRAANRRPEICNRHGQKYDWILIGAITGSAIISVAGIFAIGGIVGTIVSHFTH